MTAAQPYPEIWTRSGAAGICARRVAGLLLALLFGWTLSQAEVPRHFFLELDIANDRGGAVGMLFDFGDGIWGENSAVTNVPAGPTPQTVRLQLPTRPIRGLRLDPTPGDEIVLITGMRLLTDRGQVLLQIDPKSLRPMNQIQSIVPEGSGVRVYPTPKADDPMLRLDPVPLQQRMHEAMGRATVGRTTVVLLALGMGAMMLTAVVGAWLALGKPAGLARGAALFCIVLGGRLLWLHLYSRPVPFWDEWEGDALYILIPFLGGFLDWGAMVMTQWEHRILLTRVITLFGTLLNGEWDVRVAMTVSAIMYSATIALVATALGSTGHRIGMLAGLVLAVAAALPFDFNNVLWGGQTQMYGLVLLAITVLSLAAARRITPWVAIAAASGSLISLFTMGAGPVAPGCAVGICLVRGWFERDQRRALAGLAGIFFLAALLGVFLHSSSRAHVPFYATTFAQFQRAFIGILAWPLPPRIVFASLLWLPWIFNSVLLLRRRAASPLEWLAVGLGGWGLVNAIALGYARQYEGPPFDSRFFTPISIGALASFCSSVALMLRAPTWQLRGWPAATGTAVAAGLIMVGVTGIAGARESGNTHGEFDHRIRLYLSTGNPTPVVEKPPAFIGTEVVARLESPLLQQVLPAAHRRALAARNATGAETRIETGPLTAAARMLMKCGVAIAAFGCLAFVYLLKRSWSTAG